MQLRKSDTCVSTLTETECRNGPYPELSFKWKTAEVNRSNPTGCYVTWTKSKGYSVYFNRAQRYRSYRYKYSDTCTSERICLCRRGKATLYSIE